MSARWVPIGEPPALAAIYRPRFGRLNQKRSMHMDLTDPLAWTLEQLEELLPDDPEDASLEDFPRLEAIGAGLAAITRQIGIEIGAIDGMLRAGARRADLAAEITLLDAFQPRGELARHRLFIYAETAAMRLGIPKPDHRR